MAELTEIGFVGGTATAKDARSGKTNPTVHGQFRAAGVSRKPDGVE
jgi:hypothetical protein